MNTIRKSLAGILILSFIFTLPISTQAQDATDEVRPIPVADKPLRVKEVGITVFGFTIPGLTLDLIAITIARLAIEQILKETTVWINSGFDGNPLYATNPKQFFGKIADNVAGDFIAGSELGFLCSPFQAKIRLALQQYHTQGRQFQCSLTQVVGNIEGFYNDFSQGGWDGWFAMTQNDVNNPYGAYLEAKLELDSRIASAIGLQDKELSWNSGFLSFKDCLEYDGETGECDQYSPTRTPGMEIEKRLSTLLSTDIRQLELADELDELISALIKELLRQMVSGVQGIFR